MTAPTRRSALRHSERAGQVTNVELFFDLVFVFAVTQLSEFVKDSHSFGGFVQTAVLLAMVWQIWVYTTWSVNYLDPNQPPTRAMLLGLMLGSLVLAATIPEAMHGHGMLFALTYVAMQVGRALYVLWALRGEQLQIAFVRIISWSSASSVLVLIGGTTHGHVRTLLWALAVAVDLIGAALGFYVPGIGRSATTEWTINGGHFAERCQAFVLIALGESIVVMGGDLRIDHPSGHDIAAFAAAFLTAVGLWWIYFDRAAEDSAHRIEESRDPGRIARDAFHRVHPLIVGGVILVAAADRHLFEHPAERVATSTAWLLLGGIALFLAGHAAFKAVVWRTVSWTRVVGAAVALLLVPLAGHVSVLTLSICGLAVVVAVALADRVLRPATPAPPGRA